MQSDSAGAILRDELGQRGSCLVSVFLFFFSSRRRHTRFDCDWSSDVCSSDLADYTVVDQAVRACAALERWSAKGYVNALLRAFLRERASFEARIQADVEARRSEERRVGKECRSRWSP